MTKKEISAKCVVGRFVRVRYDDIGVVDGLIVERYNDNQGKYFEFKVYEHTTHSTNRITYDQIVAVGPYLNVPAF